MKRSLTALIKSNRNAALRSNQLLRPTLLEPIAPKRILPVHSQKLSWYSIPGPSTDRLHMEGVEPGHEAFLVGPLLLVMRCLQRWTNETRLAHFTLTIAA